MYRNKGNALNSASDWQAEEEMSRSAHYCRIVVCGKRLESGGPGASKDTEGKACELGMQWYRVRMPVEHIPSCVTVGKLFSNLRLSAFSKMK